MPREFHTTLRRPEVGRSYGMAVSRENVVVKVEKGSCADAAGLQLGDRIQRICGEPVRDSETLHKILLNPRKEFLLAVHRPSGSVADSLDTWVLVLLIIMSLSGLASLYLSSGELGGSSGGHYQPPEADEPPDYYKILELPEGPDSSDASVRSAFKKLSHKYHPDKNPSGKEKYQQVQEAYGVLSDKRRRKIYDIMGIVEDPQRQQRQQQQHHPFFSFFGMDEMDTQKGPPLRLELLVRLDDIYNGAEHVVPLRKRKLRGWEVPRGCMRCKAQPPTFRNVRMGPMIMRQQVPPDCSAECDAYSNTVDHDVNLDVTIEQGVAEGTELVFELEGDEYPDRLPGDVVLNIATPAHPVFTRRHDDLFMNMRVSLVEAVTGFSRSVTHMDGREVEVVRDVPTPHLHEMRIVGEGMPRHHVPSEKGDLFVTFLVDFPERITDDQVTALRALFQDIEM